MAPQGRHATLQLSMVFVLAVLWSMFLLRQCQGANQPEISPAAPASASPVATADAFPLPPDIDAQMSAAVAARPVTHTCTLDIRGKPGGGIKYASFICNSTIALASNTSSRAAAAGPGVPGVKAVINDTHLGALSSNIKGVDRLPPGGCGDLQALITLCGPSDHIRIAGARVTGLKDEYIAQRGGVLCLNSSVHLTLDGISASNNYGVSLRVSGAARVAIKGGYFSDNTGDAAVVVDADGSVITMDNVTFNNNTMKSNGDGSAVSLAGTNATVTNSVFANNAVDNGTGGAVYCGRDAHVTIAGCEFVNNTAEASVGGGALSVGGNAAVKVADSTKFLINSAVFGSGGAMIVRGSAAVEVTSGCLFEGNHAGVDGGAIFLLDNAALNVTGGTTFVNNHANGTGDDVKAYRDDNLHLGDTNVNMKSVGVAASSTASALSFHSCTLNLKGKPGGGIAHANFICNTTAASNASTTTIGRAAPSMPGVKAVINEDQLANVSSHFKGIDKLPPGSCGGYRCLISLCGPSDHVVITNAHIVDLGAETSDGILCVNGAAHLTLDGMNASDNNGIAPLVITGDSRVAIMRSYFSGNIGAEGIYAFSVDSDGLPAVTMDMVTFKNHFKENVGGGAVFLAGGTHATIRNCVFAENMVSGATGGALWCGGNTNVTVSGCQFLDNTAEASIGGGALSLAFNATVVVTNHTRFSRNLATLSSGGAMAVRGSGRVQLNGACLFEGNHADMDGGAVFVLEDGAANITGGTAFVNNSAKGAGSDVKALQDKSLILGITNINITSPGVSWLRKQCVVGEFKPISSDLCVVCPATTYSLSDTNTTKSFCEQCPEYANCTGGADLRPLSGFWHSSSRSTQIHSCPRNASCVGDGRCEYGYDGHLCGKCIDGWGSEGPFKCAMCMPTWKIVAIFLAVAIVLAGFLLFLVHTTLHDVATGQLRGAAARPSAFLKVLIRHLQYLVLIGTVRVGWPQSLAAIFTGVSMLFSASNGQAISLDCVYASTGIIPQAIKPLITALLAPVCILLLVLLAKLAWWSIASAPMVQRIRRAVRVRLLGAATADALQLHARASLRDVVVVTFLVVLFYFYPGLVRTSLSLFACLHLDDTSSSADPYPEYAVANASYGYWVFDVGQECWYGWHLRWGVALGVPCVLLLCFGAPVGIGLALWKTRYVVDLPEGAGTTHPLELLYINYRLKRYYWELVDTVQIALVAALSVFSITLGPFFTMLLLNLAVALFLVLQLLFRPFAFKELHSTSLLSLAVLYLTTTISLTYLSTDITPPRDYKEVTAVIGLVVNVVFVLWCIYQTVVHTRAMMLNFWGGLQGALRSRRASISKDATGRAEDAAGVDTTTDATAVAAADPSAAEARA